EPGQMFRFWSGLRAMKRKAGSGTATVTTEVREALAAAKGLSCEDERVLRMRYGVAVSDLDAPLPPAGEGNAERADEPLLLEMQLQRAQRERMSRNGARFSSLRAVSQQGSQPVSPRTKDKIVRALRKKK